MFVTIKRYLADWKEQREINASLKEINASQNEAIAALQRRVDKLEWQSGYVPPVGYGGGPGGEVPSVWSGRDANMGGLRWSDELGGYIVPGGGSGNGPEGADSWPRAGIGNKVIG